MICSNAHFLIHFLLTITIPSLTLKCTLAFTGSK